MNKNLIKKLYELMYSIEKTFINSDVENLIYSNAELEKEYPEVYLSLASLNFKEVNIKKKSKKFY